MIKRGNSRFHIGVENVADYKLGRRQLAEWHAVCGVRRARERLAAADEAHKREVADIIAWAKATAKRRLAEARAGGAL